MNRFFFRIYQTYLNPSLDFRVRLFNVLAIGGTLISFLMATLNAVNHGSIVSVIANLVVSALSFTLLTVSRRTGRYQLCYMVTIIGIFLCFFPVLFISDGGYHGGFPCFFVFAVVFTMFMLEGKKAIILSVTELTVYTVVCFFAYFHPNAIHFFTTEQAMLTNIIVSYVVISVVLGACMFLHFRLYNEQQRKLDEQNALLAEANRAKTEFLANTSHEMRTPLTVISVNVQTVMNILEDMGEAVKDPDADKLLKNAQGEVMRLARMVGGMLTLASISESAERRKVGFSAMLLSAADSLRIHLQERGNALETKIDEDLTVFCDADLLSQVVVNLIQNAYSHTSNGTIALRADRRGGEITVTVSDDGSGIAPELLPHVFERGVSEGGTGFGLYLCKTVVESHGGRIWIESEPGSGTAVYFTIPVYEGQFGDDAV